MANLKEIKKRIGSVKSTQQITKAMKMVAASRFRKAHEAVVAARPYSDKMANMVASLALREKRQAHPLLASRDKERALVLVMNSDRGLCGGFNVNVVKAVEAFVEENAEGYAAYDFMLVGRKAKEQFRGLPEREVVKVYKDITAKPTYAMASLLGQEIVKGYEEGCYDGVFLAYSAFHSAVSQEPKIAQLLPVIPKATEEEGFSPVGLIYEPTRGEVLDSVLPKYVEVQIFRAFLESLASEHGARMSAMDSATKSAGDMIGALTLEYNRVRQAVITTELMEIISGAEAIK